MSCGGPLGRSDGRVHARVGLRPAPTVGGGICPIHSKPLGTPSGLLCALYFIVRF